MVKSIIGVIIIIAIIRLQIFLSKKDNRLLGLINVDPVSRTLNKKALKND